MSAGQISDEQTAIRELDAFVDESIRLCRERGYIASGFMGMRDRYGTVGAITRLVTSGEVKSGLRRMFELGLEDRCIDAAVGMFPLCFPENVRRAAAWRLEEARREVRGSKRR